MLCEKYLHLRKWNAQFTHLLAYADNIVIIARNLIELKSLLIKLDDHAKEAGFEISEEKTKYLVVSKYPRLLHVGQNITVGTYNFERDQQFKYLGSTLTG